MNNQPSNPIAALGGIFVLTLIGLSAKHCMKKYAGKKALKFKL